MCLYSHTMKKPRFIPFDYTVVSEGDMVANSVDYYDKMNTRRSVREFSNKPVPQEVMVNNKQPWSFCLVGDPEIKKKIRLAAEKEERENYAGRMSAQWLRDLNPFGTNSEKPFLEIAPWQIVVFKRIYEIENGEKKNNYYVSESVGIATGFLLSAIHNAGLVALTHTPSPMNFLAELLNRPKNERAFLLIPVGYPVGDAEVPDITRKPLEKIISYF